MLRILAILLLLSTLAPCRTFTSTDGKKLEAEIVRADEKSVTLRRIKDRRDFILPLNRLSRADQEFIAAWGRRNFHPLDWKRLRIHSDGRTISASCLPIYGPDRRASNATLELVLPIGAWVILESPEFALRGSPGLVRFEGASDWYVSSDGPFLMVQRGKDRDEMIASVTYSEKLAADDGFNATGEAAIKRGAGVSTLTDRRAVPLLPKAPVTSMHLHVDDAKSFKWSRIPETIRALHIQNDSDSIDFEGVEACPNLEYLGVATGSLHGLEHLSSLSKLRSLFLKAEKIEGAEHAHLAKLPKLHHLSLINHNSDKLDVSHYEFLTSLRALEALSTTERYRPRTHLEPAHLARCARLTRLDAPVKSSGGLFLKEFSRLTDISFYGVTRTSAVDLLESGHLKYVHTLRDCSQEIDLAHLPALRHLHLVSAAPKPAASTVPALESLALQCRTQSTFAAICRHPSVQSVRRLAFSEFLPADLSPLKALPHLTSLHLDRAKNPALTTLDLEAFPSLRSFHASFVSLPRISGIGTVEALHLQDIPLQSLGTGAATKLKCLELSQVEHLENLDGLKDSPDLRFLSLTNCANLASHSGLADLPNLKQLHISRCALPDPRPAP